MAVRRCEFDDRAAVGLDYRGVQMFTRIYESNHHCDAANVDHAPEALRAWLWEPGVLSAVAVCSAAAEEMFRGRGGPGQ